MRVLTYIFVGAGAAIAIVALAVTLLDDGEQATIEPQSDATQAATAQPQAGAADATATQQAATAGDDVSGSANAPSPPADTAGGTTNGDVAATGFELRYQKDCRFWGVAVCGVVSGTLRRCTTGRAGIRDRLTCLAWGYDGSACTVHAVFGVGRQLAVGDQPGNFAGPQLSNVLRGGDRAGGPL